MFNPSDYFENILGIVNVCRKLNPKIKGSTSASYLKENKVVVWLYKNRRIHYGKLWIDPVYVLCGVGSITEEALKEIAFGYKEFRLPIEKQVKK